MTQATGLPPIHLCIGAPRSGTTWLFYNLLDQPEIFTPIVKEVRYWRSRRSDAVVAQTAARAEGRLPGQREAPLQVAWLDRWRTIEQHAPPTTDEYLHLMSVPDLPSMDISPVYSMLRDDTIEALHDSLPDSSRVVYFIRDPIDRMMSQIKFHFFRQGHFRGLPSEVTLTAFLRREDQRQRADYAAAIRRWSAVFGDRFRVFVYDDLAADPMAFLHAVAGFLEIGIDERVAEQTANVYYNSDRDPSQRSALPQLGGRERKIVAEALHPLVTPLAEELPAHGAAWLGVVEDSRALDAPRRGCVDDITEDAAQLMRMCENLGDNAEYAFWQQHRGYDPDSLFRWSVTPIAGLLAFLRNPDLLFAEENLTPHSEGMVTDSAYGFTLASRLVESDGDGRLRLVSDPERRHAQYEAERSEVEFLQRKFFTELRNHPCIYIVKRNEGLAEHEVTALLDLLRESNPDHHVLWVEQGDSRRVEKVRPGLFRGEVERFAPYEKPDDYVFGGWTNLMTELARKRPVRQLVARMLR